MNEARDCGFEIQSKIEQKKMLIYEATIITQQPREDVGSTATKDPHSKFDRYAIMTEQLTNQIHELNKTKHEAMEMIELIEDSRLRDVLFDYYINRNSWETVSNHLCLDYDGRRVYALRAEAINCIEKILNPTQKNTKRM